MKKKTIICVAVLLFFTMLFIAFFTNIANADVNLDQCTINNTLDVCNQSFEKSQEIVNVQVVEVKKEKLTLEDFINELVKIVKERKAENDIVVTSYFEDDVYNSSILVKNQNEIKCVNNVCAKEKEWR